MPQVAKLVENVEEETPRTLLKGICETMENPVDFAASHTRCNSTSVAEAAASAAAAAAATTAAATAAVTESATVVRNRGEDGGAEYASISLPHPTVSILRSLCFCVRGGTGVFMKSWGTISHECLNFLTAWIVFFKLQSSQGSSLAIRISHVRIFLLLCGICTGCLE